MPHSEAAKRLLPGDLVEVKPAPEIFATLDSKGSLAGLPFMPEMLQYCGRTFKVWRRVEKTCVESDRIRRIEDVVFLDDLRCDGSAHGECEKECRIFWHEAWLRPPRSCAAPGGSGDPSTAGPFPYPVMSAPNRYVCQSTELIAATRPLSKADLRQYLRDLRVRTWTLREMLRFVRAAFLLRASVVLRGRGSVMLSGNRTRTPAASLGLKPGEWVEVKSRSEIAATLDREGKNRGLQFPIYMLPFFGRRFRVRRRVNRVILETTGEIREIKNTVVLEGATCDGFGRWGGCPRDSHHLWREIWLRRVGPPDGGDQ